MNFTSEKGLTYIELLLVVVIGALLVTLATPSVQQTMRHYRLSASANLLASELETARLLAISRGAVYSLAVDAGTGSLQVVDPDDPENPPRVVRTLDPGIRFSEVPDQPVLFFSRGGARGGTFQLENERGRTVVIEVRASGLINVREEG